MNNSPGSYFFNTTFWGGVIQEEEELCFQCHLSTFYKLKSISNCCKTKILGQRTKPIVYAMSSLGSYLREGVIFSMSEPRGGVIQGRVIQRNIVCVSYRFFPPYIIFPSLSVGLTVILQVSRLLTSWQTTDRWVLAYTSACTQQATYNHVCSNNFLYSETRLVRTLGYNVRFLNAEHRTLDRMYFV